MRLCDKILKIRALYYFRNQSLSNIYNTNFDSLSFYFIGAFDCLPVAKVHSQYPLSLMQKHAGGYTVDGLVLRYKDLQG